MGGSVWKEIMEKHMNTKKILQTKHYLHYLFVKCVKYMIESITYSIEFSAGKGYPQLNCWECQKKIHINRKRWVKCPQCSSWNLHPIWGNQGENVVSFLKKFSIFSLVCLLLLGIFCLATYGFSQILYWFVNKEIG